MDIDAVLNSLTIDEKIRLLNGVGDWHTSDCNGKISSAMMTDGPHGLRKVEVEKLGDINGSVPATCFPTASAIASSFNPDAAELMAKTIAKEAKKERISVVLGCGVNIKRSPLCGRNFEYFSEDPYLAGKLGTAYIKGMQEEGVGTSLKHFAANSQEQYRMTSNSQVDERALREIYLSAFEMIVKEAKPTTIMACYNRINGEYGCANKHLLTDILRNEWGFDGAVISDWGATVDILKCLKAGLDLEMPDSRGYHPGIIKKAYDEGEISEELINTKVRNVLKSITSLAENTDAKEAIDYDRHHEIARQIEDECAVLLKNENNALPVSKDKHLIVVGELAYNIRYQGGGSSHINATGVSNAVDALKAAGYDISYFQGYRNDTDAVDEKLQNETVEGVRRNLAEYGSDAVILMFMGLTDMYEGEGYDRENLDIPMNQKVLLDELSEMVNKINQDIIISAVTFGGAPMDYSWEDKTSAILHMHLGGQAVGDSIADLISGKVCPSGKLAETIPLTISDTPAYRYFATGTEDVQYRESIFVGYRYYETFNVPVRYPFGYGLSYTTFEYSNLSVAKTGDNYKVTVAVKNIGKCEGAEIIQLYVLPMQRDFLRSSIELKGFGRVSLLPGESREVELTMDNRAFSIYNVDSERFDTVGGEYIVAVGASVRDLKLETKIFVDGNTINRNDRELLPSYFRPQLHGMDIPEEEFVRLYGRPVSKLDDRKRGDFDGSCSFNMVSRSCLFGRMLRGVVYIAVAFMCRGMSKANPAYKMTELGVLEGSLEGLISMGGGAFPPKLVDILLLNANRHYMRAFLRLFKK